MTIFIKSQIIKVKFGKKIKVIEPVNLYGCTIEDNCFIGPFVEIQKNVLIKKNTRIQSHTFICEKVTIGKNCFIGHGVMFTNDKFESGKPSGKNKIKPTYVGNNVSICSNVVIGAGSVVTKNITKKGTYAGNPARLIKKT